MSNIAMHVVESVDTDRYIDRISTALSPLFLFRLAGLPLEALRAIESKNLTMLTEKIDRHQQTLLAYSDPLNEALHLVINQVAKDEELRCDMRELIELKRAVHNNRAPKRTGAIDIAKRYLDSAQGQMLDVWAEAAFGMKADLAACADALTLDQEQSRIAIHAWSNRPIFKRALQISNAQLEEKLDHYFARQETQITHKHRLLDNSLFGYFLRACTKTSPFSTFGVVSYGLWSDLHPGKPAHLATNIAYKTQTRLNAALLARLASSISKAKIANEAVDLKLNPTCIFKDGRVHFLRLRTRPLSRLMAFGSLTSHGMFSIALTASLKTMVTMLSAGDPLPFKQLMHNVGAELGKGNEEIKSWLVYLMEVGLLESTDAYDAASYVGLLEHVRSGASQIGSEVLSNFVERAESITRQMDTDDVVQRRTFLKGISEAVRDLARDADGLQLKLEASTIFYEDAAVAGDRYGLPFAGNAPFIDHLKQLQQLQPIFDTGAPLRAALAEYFKKRFGAGGECTDVPRFSEEFARECSGPFWNVSSEAKTIEMFDASFDIKNSKNIRASRVLHCLRNLCMRHLRQIGRAGAGGEVTIGAERIARLRSHMPTRLHEIYSGAFFVQPCTDGSTASSWVLNKIYGGSGQLMSRLLYLWESERDDLATRTLRSYIADNVPPGSVIAELPGNGDSNLNFHPTLVEHVIGAAGANPGQDRINIALSDLRIRHDAVTDKLTLVSASGGHQVLPVYLGGLVSELLPDVQKLLLLFGVSTSVALPSWDSLFRSRSVSTVFAYPRLSVGNIVVLRKMWAVAPELVPRRAAGESDAELYLRTQAWRRKNNLPVRSYITFSRPDGMQEANQRKPMFFDLSSVRSLQAFQKELEKHEGVLWLAEALPDPAPDAVPAPLDGAASETTSDGQTAVARHHCEYIFDLTSTTRY